MYEVLFNNIKKYDADISVCGYYRYFKNKTFTSNDPKEFEVWNTKESIGSIWKINSSAVNKLYKRKIFKDIRYPVGKLYEDTFIIVDVLMAATRVVLTGKPLYYYVSRGGSITKNTFNPKSLSVIDAWSAGLEKVKKHFPNQIVPWKAKYIFSYLQVLDKVISCEDYKSREEYKNVKSFIKSTKWEILKNPYITISRKLAILAFLVRPVIYKRIISSKQNKYQVF